MEDNKQQSYFADVPQGLANSCDTLLLLDDGTKLPVHAAILARLSGVFSGMLDGGPLAAASQNNVVVVPIEECAKDVASRFLSIVYTGESQEHITESSAWNLADLGHKLNMKGLIKTCDEYLSDVAGFHADKDTIPWQGRTPECILQMMKSADRLNMPRTLACCERHVAIDSANTLRTKVGWEHIPACSSVRIARGLDAAYDHLMAHAISQIDSLNHDIRSMCYARTKSAIASIPTDTASYVNACKRDISMHVKLRSVPPCKAFLQMAESVLNQAEAKISS